MNQHNLEDLKKAYGGFDNFIAGICENANNITNAFVESTLVLAFISCGYNVNTSWEFMCNQSCIESETAKHIQDYVNNCMTIYYKHINMLLPSSLSFPTKAFNQANVEMYNMWKDMWVRAERTYDTMLRARDDDFSEF